MYLNSYIPFTMLFWQQVQNFGEPFFLIIHEGETLAEVKERIQKKLQVPDEEFSKVSLCPSSLLQYAAAVTNHEHTLTHTVYTCRICLKKTFVLYIISTIVWFEIWNLVFCFVISGSLLFYHWVVQSTCRILTLCPAVFRCLKFKIIFFLWMPMACAKLVIYPDRVFIGFRV